jgi:GAF domain-containing protein
VKISELASGARTTDGGPARQILQGTVNIARTVFDAYSASVLLLDESAGQLVFEAVAHPDEQGLVGMSFPANSGIAGWVLQSGQTMMMDDVSADPNFARQTAQATGYVPRGLIAAPISGDGDWIGVLEVLDRTAGYRGSIADVALLALLADQAAASLEMILEVRRADTALRLASREDGGGGRPGLRLLEPGNEAMAAVEDILRHITDVSSDGAWNDGSVELLVSLSRVLNSRARDVRSAW